MPRAFSEGEQQLIRSRLLAAGKRLVAERGIRGVVVEELAREAGIAKGSFYAFYPSREDLILSVLEKWEVEFREELARGIEAAELDPRQRLEAFVLRAFEVFERQPGLLRIGSRDIEELVARLPPERLAAHQAADRRYLEGLFESWLERGLLEPGAREVLPALVPLIFTLAIHREDFPAGSFGPMAALLARALARVLAPKETA